MGKRSSGEKRRSEASYSNEYESIRTCEHGGSCVKRGFAPDFVLKTRRPCICQPLLDVRRIRCPDVQMLPAIVHTLTEEDYEIGAHGKAGTPAAAPGPQSRLDAPHGPPADRHRRARAAGAAGGTAPTPSKAAVPPAGAGHPLCSPGAARGRGAGSPKSCGNASAVPSGCFAPLAPARARLRPGFEPPRPPRQACHFNFPKKMMGALEQENSGLRVLRTTNPDTLSSFSASAVRPFVSLFAPFRTNWRPAP